MHLCCEIKIKYHGLKYWTEIINLSQTSFPSSLGDKLFQDKLDLLFSNL